MGRPIYVALKKVLGGRVCANDKNLSRRLGKFIECQVSSGQPPYGWDLASVLIFPDRRRSVVLEGRAEFRAKYKAYAAQKEREIPESRLTGSGRRFLRIPKNRRINFPGRYRRRIIGIEAVAWGSAFQCPKFQVGEMPASLSEGWEGLSADGD